MQSGLSAAGYLPRRDESVKSYKDLSEGSRQLPCNPPSQLAQAARTKYHELGGLQTADIYLPLSGDWESKTTVAADSVPGGAASRCVLRGRGGEGTLQGLFYKDNNAPS